MRGKVTMLELTMCGLVGLAAMLVVAFYFACCDEFPLFRKKSSHDLTIRSGRRPAEVSRG